jgi:hypothetical protein
MYIVWLDKRVGRLGGYYIDIILIIYWYYIDIVNIWYAYNMFIIYCSAVTCFLTDTFWAANHGPTHNFTWAGLFHHTVKACRNSYAVYCDRPIIKSSTLLSIWHTIYDNWCAAFRAAARVAYYVIRWSDCCMLLATSTRVVCIILRLLLALRRSTRVCSTFAVCSFYIPQHHADLVII